MTKSNDSQSSFRMPTLTYRVWKVWRRNFDVFTKTIHVNFLPSVLEPILYLVALGYGLGTFVPDIEGVPYRQFIAPALIAIAIMYGSFFECTYASFVRMYFQKTFDAIIATPVSVEEVIAGELVWGATRATINSAIVLAVVAAFGLVSSPLFLLVPLLAFFGGLMFAALGMCFTAFAQNIDFFNYPSFLLVTPMFLLSGTFFPLSSLPGPVQTAALAVLPLTHVANLTRGLVLGRIDTFLNLSTEATLLLSIAWISVITVFFFILSINLMKKKLIK
ncbi:MAG TPA: ABC transporter permease [Candidatus Bathyarchaeia archaeon]|nr:ABC transporter permease [Candidatus Bathyarchaeia archaeon]